MAKPLIVAVDTRYLRVAKTGTRTYLEELCKEFKNLNGNEVQFYFLDTGLPLYTGTNKILKLIEHLRHQLWKQLILPVKAWLKKSDIVFCTDDCVPLLHLKYKTVAVIHDAFCFEMPQNYGKLWLWLYLHTAVPAAKKSAFVITPTQYAKKQISKYIQIADNKLIVIPEGPKTLTDNNEENSQLSAFGLTTGEYILHVGSMFKRKNIPSLINAFTQLKKSGYVGLKLVLAGPLPANVADNSYKEITAAIASSGLHDQIIITGYLDDATLSELYTNALLYVFPSINEGFGIPILEAFKHDVPVLVAKNTCLPEVGGDAVLQFDPFDVNDIALKIKTMLDDKSLRDEMMKKGRERLNNFSWHKTATQLIEVFKRAI